MPRKKGGGRKKPRRIEVNISKISIPEGTTRKQYFQTLKRGLSDGELPDGWEIDIAWRNPDTKVGRSKDWQQGDWQSVLEASTEGFKQVVKNVIKRYAGDDWGGRLVREPVKKQRAKKPIAGKPKKKTPKPSQTLPLTTAAKRSAAAKKGWATRRKNAGKNSPKQGGGSYGKNSPKKRGRK